MFCSFILSRSAWVKSAAECHLLVSLIVTQHVRMNTLFCYPASTYENTRLTLLPALTNPLQVYSSADHALYISDVSDTKAKSNPVH